MTVTYPTGIYQNIILMTLVAYIFYPSDDHAKLGALLQQSLMNTDTDYTSRQTAL